MTDTGNIDSIAFRPLASAEVDTFHQWARDNDTPTHRAKAELYHPEVRAEWARIDAVVNHPTTVAVKAYRYDSNHSTLAGRFPRFSSVGSYTILYHCADGGHLCGNCVSGDNGSDVGSDDAVYDDGTSDPQWTVIGAGTYDEGPTLQCDHCQEDIESSYGDPNAPKIKIDNMDGEDGSVLVTCEDRDVAEEHHSIAGSNWEAPSDMTSAYAIISDSPDLVSELEKEGYDVDSGEYSPPDS
jgi:hypothetical protein